MNSDYAIKRDVPPFFLEEEDTAKLLEIFQHGFEWMYEDITNFLTTIDYEKCDEKYLDLMLIESGWILQIPLDITLKRKVIKTAQEMYLQKGLKVGIINAILKLMGLTVTITEVIFDTFRINKTGVSLSYIGLNNTDKKASHFLGNDAGLMSFRVNSPTLTSAQESMMEKIIDYMKWAPTIYLIEKP
jgi:phage tail-like protein